MHCIIIGFSLFSKRRKYIYYGEDNVIEADNINPYLANSDNILVSARRKPLADVPEMMYGNKPADGRNLIIEECDYQAFLDREPAAKKYIRQYIGANEYLHNKKRYCLWLKGANPNELKSMPLVLQRMEKCKKSRENSVAAAIRKFAATPFLFAQITQPEGKSYIVIPGHSSSGRKYIPFGFVSHEIISSNAVFIIPDADIFHFGILISNVHNMWVRAICGRIKSDYRYSKEIVYNNFPWPEETPDQKVIIEERAQKVLEARALYADSSLATLYDPLIMPPELLKAHKNLDRVVMKLYGYPREAAEPDIVADLMKRYQKLMDITDKRYPEARGEKAN